MNSRRFARSLIRSTKVTWREQPTRHDIEALQANIERVGLVIRVRWAIVALLAFFSLVSIVIYSAEVPFVEIVWDMRVPALAGAFVIAYNAYYHLTYRRLGNIALLNHAQLLFDVVVTAVLVYYSGGVNSWFYALYLLFILEAAFILPRVRDTWLIAASCALVHGVVVWGGQLGLLAHVPVLLSREGYPEDALYVAVRYTWQIVMFGGAAMVATLMTGALSAREASIADSSIIDERTGLYERGYFLRALGSEIRRAERDGRPLWVLLIDIDDFAAFNDTFGIDLGDALLGRLGPALTEALAEWREDEASDTNLIARYGGEEFAALISEGRFGGPPQADDAINAAETFRVAIERTFVKGVGATASVGAACFPADGQTLDGVLTAADEALYRAAAAGGNRVVLAS